MTAVGMFAGRGDVVLARLVLALEGAGVQGVASEAGRFEGYQVAPSVPQSPIPTNPLRRNENGS